MQETLKIYSIPGLGRYSGGGNDNPLCILVWKIPWTEELGRLWSMGPQRVRQQPSGGVCTCMCTRAHTHTHTHTHTEVPDRNSEVWPTAGASLREVLWGLWDLPLAPPDSLSILLSLGGWPTWIIRGTSLLLAVYWVWSVREHPQKMREGGECSSGVYPLVPSLRSHDQPKLELPLDRSSHSPPFPRVRNCSPHLLFRAWER